MGGPMTRRLEAGRGTSRHQLRAPAPIQSPSFQPGTENRARPVACRGCRLRPHRLLAACPRRRSSATWCWARTASPPGARPSIVIDLSTTGPSMATALCALNWPRKGIAWVDAPGFGRHRRRARRQARRDGLRRPKESATRSSPCWRFSAAASSCGEKAPARRRSPSSATT